MLFLNALNILLIQASIKFNVSQIPCIIESLRNHHIFKMQHILNDTEKKNWQHIQYNRTIDFARHAGKENNITSTVEHLQTTKNSTV